MATIQFGKTCLTTAEINDVIANVAAWFKQHPKRKTCPVDLGVMGTFTLHRTTFRQTVKSLG